MLRTLRSPVPDPRHGGVSSSSSHDDYIDISEKCISNLEPIERYATFLRTGMKIPESVSATRYSYGQYLTSEREVKVVGKEFFELSATD